MTDIEIIRLLELQTINVIIRILDMTYSKRKKFRSQRSSLMKILSNDFPSYGNSIYKLLGTIGSELQECKENAIIESQQQYYTPSIESSEEKQEHEELLQKMRALILPDDKIIGMKREDIVGLDDAIKSMEEGVEYAINLPYLFDNIFKPWRGILLYGVPGTGKTSLARYVAGVIKERLLKSSGKNLAFMNVTPANLSSNIYGGTEKAINALFEVARENVKNNRPTVIFFDEVDAMMRNRTSQGTETDRRIKSTFLVQLDGFEDNTEIVFIGATNTPQEIDPAFLRRLEKQIYIGLPDDHARSELIRHALMNGKMEDDVLQVKNSKQIVEATRYFSASDINSAIRSAYLTSISKMLQTGQKFKIHEGRAIPCADGDDLCLYTKEEIENNGIQFAAPKITLDTLLTAIKNTKTTVDENVVEALEKWQTK